MSAQKWRFHWVLRQYFCTNNTLWLGKSTNIYTRKPQRNIIVIIFALLWWGCVTVRAVMLSPTLTLRIRHFITFHMAGSSYASHLASNHRYIFSLQAPLTTDTSMLASKSDNTLLITCAVTRKCIFRYELIGSSSDKAVLEAGCEEIGGTTNHSLGQHWFSSYIQ